MVLVIYNFLQFFTIFYYLNFVEIMNKYRTCDHCPFYIVDMEMQQCY